MESANKNNDIPQRKLVKWTRAYFWATVAMAVAAAIAAGFTIRYVLVTKGILEQAQSDSEKEYRPYIIAQGLEMPYELIDSTDTEKTYRIFITIDFKSCGKTPALDFASTAFLNTDKAFIEGSEASILLNLENTETFSILFGDASRYIKKHFYLRTPINCKEGDIILYKYGEEIFKPIKIDNIKKTPLYYHIAYSYMDIEESYKYLDHFTICILFNLKKERPRYESFWDSYKMKTYKIVN